MILWEPEEERFIVVQRQAKEAIKESRKCPRVFRQGESRTLRELKREARGDFSGREVKAFIVLVVLLGIANVVVQLLK